MRADGLDSIGLSPYRSTKRAEAAATARPEENPLTRYSKEGF